LSKPKQKNAQLKKTQAAGLPISSHSSSLSKQKAVSTTNAYIILQKKASQIKKNKQKWLSFAQIMKALMRFIGANATKYFEARCVSTGPV
jgi:hypothetical protein